jgi:hypothetical protein
MLMEAAKDIASVNEAITGDAARNAPVGTTLALIEQGQQVFNAIYKRIYRALRKEFRLLADCQRRYGDPQEYARFCDEPAPQPSPDAMAAMGHNGGPQLDPNQPPATASPEAAGAGAGGDLQPPSAPTPQPLAGAPEGGAGPTLAPPTAPVDPVAMFKADFDSDDMDVQPVSDPSAVTKVQLMARAQFNLSLVPTGMVNPKVAVRRALEAAGEDGIDELMTLEPPKPDPVQMQMLALEAQLKDSQAKQHAANATLATAKASEIVNEQTGAQADLNAVSKAAVAQKQMVEAYAIAANALGPAKIEAPKGGE